MAIRVIHSIAASTAAGLNTGRTHRLAAPGFWTGRANCSRKQISPASSYSQPCRQENTPSAELLHPENSNLTLAQTTHNLQYHPGPQ
ncbi:MAG: hypothetical protein GX902_09160 [Lentisphaerae bacterium]|nr:hypothetical protein [Lentisphaerota bacterium]